MSVIETAIPTFKFISLESLYLLFEDQILLKIEESFVIALTDVDSD